MKIYSENGTEELIKLYDDKLATYESKVKEAVAINNSLQNKLTDLIEIRVELFDLIGELKKRGEPIEGYFENETAPTT